jgi:geranylgeranyl reductase family protein
MAGPGMTDGGASLSRRSSESSSDRRRVDVAVVGAGPSGSWTAKLLAERGARVVLIDPSHPREKPCGGGVTGRALALLADATPDLRSVRITAAQFVDSRAQTKADVPLPFDSTALVVASRTEFDGALLDAARRAGAEILSRRVIDVSREASAFALGLADGTHISASFVIGADGANSLIRRRLATPFRRDQLSIATGYFAHGVSSDRIVIEMLSEPPGYIWSFPRPDHLAIGICAQADAGVGVDTLRHFVRRWIDQTGLADGARLEPYSWPIPSLSARDFRSVAIAGAAWLTVGDAAGLVDPITREGIFFALQSAVAAADTLAAAADDRAGAYTSRIRDEIGSDLACAARYKAGFFRPRFTRLLVDALRTSSEVRGVMADLVAGLQSYRGLKWRLLRTAEFGLAWRVFTMGR